jgi:hypothetical protein
MGHDKTRLNPLASGVRNHTTANRPQWQNPAKSRADSETMWSGDNKMCHLQAGAPLAPFGKLQVSAFPVANVDSKQNAGNPVTASGPLPRQISD